MFKQQRDESQTTSPSGEVAMLLQELSLEYCAAGAD